MQSFGKVRAGNMVAFESDLVCCVRLPAVITKMEAREVVCIPQGRFEAVWRETCNHVKRARYWGVA